MEKKDFTIIIAIAATALLVVVFFLGVLFNWWGPKKEAGGATPYWFGWRLLTSQEQAKSQAIKELDTLATINAKEDTVVPGVAIVFQDNKKTLVNNNEGYSMEIPSAMLVARSIESSNINLYEPDKAGDICGDPECPPIINIKARNNEAKWTLDEWAQKEQERVGSLIFQNKETLLINGLKTFRIQEETERTPPIYYYFLAKNNKVYRLSLAKSLEPKYKQYIESFVVK